MATYQDVFKRVELKYLLSARQYEALRERLTDLAEPDAYGESQILNIYYDTPDFRLIRSSLMKPVYKEKLRLRSYGVPTGETNTFVELKKKYKGVVYKRRVNMSYREAGYFLGNGILQHEPSQIEKEIFWFMHYYGTVVPAMAVSYDRIAMAGIEDPDLRITFDRNIRWRTDQLDLRRGSCGQDLLQPGQRLMELKIAGAVPLELAGILDELEIRQLSFSKYGSGYEEMQRQQWMRAREGGARRLPVTGAGASCSVFGAVPVQKQRISV